MKVVYPLTFPFVPRRATERRFVPLRLGTLWARPNVDTEPLVGYGPDFDGPAKGPASEGMCSQAGDCPSGVIRGRATGWATPADSFLLGPSAPCRPGPQPPRRHRPHDQRCPFPGPRLLYDPVGLAALLRGQIGSGPANWPAPAGSWPARGPPRCRCRLCRRREHRRGQVPKSRRTTGDAYTRPHLALDLSDVLGGSNKSW